MFPKKIDSIKLKIVKIGLIIVGVYILTFLSFVFLGILAFPIFYFAFLISGIAAGLLIKETLPGRILYAIFTMVVYFFLTWFSGYAFTNLIGLFLKYAGSL